MAKAKKLDEKQKITLLQTLDERFRNHATRHQGMQWSVIASRLERNPVALLSLHEMERTGGEPDVVGHDVTADVYIFNDCAPESPAGRRSLCYDKTALDARKENKPTDSALSMCEAMGIDLLTEAEYRNLQRIGAFDLKTSSWVRTSPAVRKLGGALFCDRRYDTVFVYHNGAESYYASRGFRGSLRI